MINLFYFYTFRSAAAYSEECCGLHSQIARLPEIGWLVRNTNHGETGFFYEWGTNWSLRSAVFSEQGQFVHFGLRDDVFH